MFYLLQDGYNPSAVLQEAQERVHHPPAAGFAGILVLNFQTVPHRIGGGLDMRPGSIRDDLPPLEIFVRGAAPGEMGDPVPKAPST